MTKKKIIMVFSKVVKSVSKAYSVDEQESMAFFFCHVLNLI